MNIKLSRILLAGACVAGLGLAGLVHARSVAAANSETAPATSPTTGYLVATFTIAFQSNIPTSDTIACEVTLNVSGESTTFKEVAIRAGARSGNNATCIVPIHYSWLLQHPGSDSINVTYATIVPPESLESPTITFPYRENDQSGTITPVPASGTQTNVSVDVTL